MKNLLFFIASLLLLFACDIIKISPDAIHEETLNPITSAVKTKGVIPTNHSISDHLIKIISEDRFEGKSIASVDTICNKGGDILLYVVNYDNGWALIAGDDRSESIILAYDDEGHFNHREIVNPELEFWLDLTKQSIQDAIDKDEKSPEPMINRALTKSGEPYYWIRIPLGQSTTIQDGGQVDPLLNTKWGQEYPWNTKCPYWTQTYRCPAGCVAVATAQILYYLVTQKNYPIGLYHQITPTYSYNTVGNYYYISSIIRDQFNNPSSRWSSMPLAYPGNNTSYVADLLVDIGEVIGMHYTGNGSGVFNMDQAFWYYNVGSTSSAYYFSVVKESLNDGYPVMVGAYSTSYYTGGHVWVIDGYRDYEATVDKSYRWYMASSDSLSYYTYDLCYTEAEKQQYAPEANEEDIFHEYTYGSDTYLRMNWGWDGNGDTAHYYLSNSSWPTYVNGYNYYPMIVTDFYILSDPENE